MTTLETALLAVTVDTAHTQICCNNSTKIIKISQLLILTRSQGTYWFYQLALKIANSVFNYKGTYRNIQSLELKARK